MSQKRARFVGHPDGVHLSVPVATEGEPPRHVHVKHGGQLPTEIDGHSVPASFRDSLLTQKDNWTIVSPKRRAPKRRAAKPSLAAGANPDTSTTAATADKKEG